MANGEQIIVKKRNGHRLTDQEIQAMVAGYVTGDIPDYQMAAFLMAVYFQGMSFDETYSLTRQMVDSGTRVDFSHLTRVPVDKHSTGGVGDKVSLILAPLVASAGVAVPMMSGRALGHSGGTLDKLEAIPGFRTRLTLEEFVKQVETIGVAMIGQTDNIVPADRKIYALRDRTGTVPSIPLVVASILSKKIAEGARALVLDVKTGKGAFFTTESDAQKLAQTIIAISEKFDLVTTALMTGMDQPLGLAVGNWLETLEAIQILRGEGPKDVIDITLALGAEMLKQAGIVDDLAAGQKKLANLLGSGHAFEKFLSIVTAQSGDVSVVENPDSYPKSDCYEIVTSPKDGFIHSIDALKIGVLAMEIGAGRKKITDQIDYGAGIVLKKKVGDPVSHQEPLAELFMSKDFPAGYIAEKMNDAIRIGEEPVAAQPLILKYINEKRETIDWYNHAE